jgi:hypothetical protein
MRAAIGRRPAKLPAVFSPLCLYHFDGTTDGADQSGNSRTLTIGTTPTLSGSIVGAKKGAYAGKYTRTDAALRLTGAMTALAIVHTTSLSGGKIIMGCGVPGTSGATNVLWSLGTNGANIRYFAESGATGVDTSLAGAQVLTGEFCMLSMRRSSGTAISLAINGVALVTGTCTQPDNGGSSVFSVGGDSAGGNAWGALIDQCAVYGSALSDAQLQYLADIAIFGGQ